MQVKGTDKNGSREYKFRCLLKNYQSNGTPLDKKLISESDANGFCDVLNAVTGIEVVRLPPKSKSSRKRKSAQDVPG